MIEVKRERRPINQAPLSTRTNQSVHNVHLFGLKLLLLLEWNTLSFCLVLIFSLLVGIQRCHDRSPFYLKKQHPFGRNEIPDLEEEKQNNILTTFLQICVGLFLVSHTTK
jgi:hypothetical protein